MSTVRRDFEIELIELPLERIIPNGPFSPRVVVSAKFKTILTTKDSLLIATSTASLRIKNTK
jgi:hypothetical protein